jgi:hypothetical protein
VQNLLSHNFNTLDHQKIKRIFLLGGVEMWKTDFGSEFKVLVLVDEFYL